MTDSPPSRVRSLVLALLAMGALSAYLTRSAISVAATAVEAELSLSHEQMGAVFAAFSAGYSWCQIPGGWIGTRYGRRAALTAFGALWSLFAGATALAGSLAGLWAARFATGVTQAGFVPNAGKTVDDWFPVTSRGLASATVAASMSAGAVIASGLTAILLPVIGWRAVYGIYMLQGLVWAAAFWFLFRDRPDGHPWVNSAEAALIAKDRPPAAQAAAPLRIAAAFRSGSLWADCAQAFFRAFGYAFFITWFPAYLQKAHGVRVTDAGLLTMAPLIGFVVGSMAGGTVIDYLLRRTGSKWISRCLMAAVAMTVCAGATLLASLASSPGAAVAVIAFGSLFLGSTGPASWAATIDIGRAHTALIFGVVNMVGVGGDLLCPMIVGKLFSLAESGAGEWNWILYLFAAINLAGAVSWLLLNPLAPVCGDPGGDSPRCSSAT